MLKKHILNNTNNTWIILDLGSSGLRASLLDRNGHILYQTKSSYTPYYLASGLVEQNPLDWKKAMLTSLAKVMAVVREENFQLISINITAQRSSVIPVDANGKALTHAIMWQDKRARPILEALVDKDREICALCGSSLNTVYSGPKMAWIKQNQHSVYQKAYKLITPIEYLIFHLTGQFAIDSSYASRSLLMNLADQSWDPQLLKHFDIDIEKLSPIVEPGSTIGYLQEELLDLFGMAKDLQVPIRSVGGDQQCSAVGLGLIDPGMLEITASTGGYMALAVDRYPETVSENLNANIHAIPGLYLIEGNLLSCAAAFNYFVNLLYKDETHVYDTVTREMEPYLSSGTPVKVNPSFQDKFISSDGKDGAAIQHISLSTKRGEIAFACLEGLAKQFKSLLDDIQRTCEASQIDSPISQQVMVGGGLTNNKIFLKLLAQTTGLELLKAPQYESTLYGAWMLATVKDGLFPTYGQAMDTIKRLYPPQRILFNR